MFKNMRLSTKQIGGFLLVSVILLAVGLVGYTSMAQISEKLDSLVKATPLVDAAMEMKLAVVTDQQMIMEMLASTDKERLDEVWGAHEEAVIEFDTYADAILKGAKTAEGTIYATESDVLKRIVREADGFHNNEFQPRIKKIYNLMLEEYDLNKKAKENMRKIEKAFDKILDYGEEFEGIVKNRIAERLEEGASAQQILDTENTWADVAMEIKTSIALSRVHIEEYVQSFEADSLEDIEKEYLESIEKFDAWINALLNGAVTKEGTIAPINDTELRAMAVEMDKLHNDEYQNAASKVLEMQKRVAVVKTNRSVFDREADEIGGKTAAMLGEIEETAKNEIDSAREAALTITSSASLQLILWIIGGFIVSIFLGTFISQSITRPINKIIYDLENGSAQVTSASSQISQSSQQLSSGAAEQAASLEESSSALEEIAAQAKQNADSASNSADAVKDMATAVKQTSENSGVANKLAGESRSAVEDGAKSMEEIATSMGEIKTGSDKITDIIEVINEITQQTKMLATNAAIEAARAGDQGKGFAVVADEVSKLAENSKTSAKEIAGLIKESSLKAQSGNEMAEKGRKAMKNILEKSIKLADLVSEISLTAEEQSGKVGKVDEMVEGINKASDQQANGVDQVTKAITQMDQVTQQNAANSEETAAAAEELTAQSESLMGIIEQLARVIGGSDGRKGDDGHKVHAFSTDHKKHALGDDIHHHLQFRKSDYRKRALASAYSKGHTGSKETSMDHGNPPVKPPEEIPMKGDFKEF